MDYNKTKLPKPLAFEWDEGNSSKSVRKHNITNKESEEIFFNQPIIILDDSKHSSNKEKRYLVLGVTNAHKLLSTIITLRNDMIRVISSRPMSKIERKIYEK